MNDEVITVPFAVLEGEREQHREDKVRWFIIVLVLIILLFGTNAAWIVYESQFQDEVVTETYNSEADGSGLAIVNRDGTVNYGESDIHPDYETQIP